MQTLKEKLGLTNKEINKGSLQVFEKYHMLPLDSLIDRYMMYNLFLENLYNKGIGTEPEKDFGAYYLAIEGIKRIIKENHSIDEAEEVRDDFVKQELYRTAADIQDLIYDVFWLESEKSNKWLKEGLPDGIFIHPYGLEKKIKIKIFK